MDAGEVPSVGSPGFLFDNFSSYAHSNTPEIVRIMGGNEASREAKRTSDLRVEIKDGGSSP